MKKLMGPLLEIRVKQSTSKSHYHPLRRSGTKKPVGFSIALPERSSAWTELSRLEIEDMRVRAS